MPNNAIVRQVQGALEHEPRINLHRFPVRVRLEEGAVALEGEVESIAAKKLALEMDPLVQAGQITATCRHYVVTLAGYARTAEERRQADLDAWALFAVDKVINRIEVRG